MSKNILPKNPEQLKTITLNLVSGLEKHRAEIGEQRDPAMLLQALTDVTTVQSQFQFTISHRATVLMPALKAADAEVKKYLGDTTKLFRSQLGERWSQGWLERGFTGNSTAVPTRRDEQERLLESVLAFLTKEPQWASTDLNVTAVRAEQVLAALTKAKADVKASRVEQGLLGQARTKAIRRLQKRIRGTIDDLSAELDAASPLWSSFGVNAPVRASRKEVQAEADRTAAKEQRALQRLTTAAERKKKALEEELARMTEKVSRHAAGERATSADVAASNGSGEVVLPR